MKKRKITSILLVLTLILQVFFASSVVFAQPQSRELPADLIEDDTLNAAVRAKYNVPPAQVLDQSYIQTTVTGWLPIDSASGYSTITSLEGLQYATNLEQINVSGNLGLHSLDQIASLNKLTQIYAYTCGISALPPTVNWPILDTLSMSGQVGGAISLEPIKNISTLKILSVGDCGITSLPASNTWNSLDALYLQSNPGITSVAPIADLPLLRALSVSDCGLTSLPVNTWADTMDFLDITNNHIADLSPVHDVAAASGPSNIIKATGQTITLPPLIGNIGNPLYSPNPLKDYNGNPYAPNPALFTGDAMSYNSVTNEVSINASSSSGTATFGMYPTNIAPTLPYDNWYSAIVTQNYTAGPPLATLNLTADSFSSIYGEDVIFTATVNGPSGLPTPTGTVTLTFDDGRPNLQLPIVGGVATFEPTVDDLNLLHAGLRTITATYNGDTTYTLPTPPDTLSHTVKEATPIIMIDAVPAPGVLNAAITVTVSGISDIDPDYIPTGTVDLVINGVTTPLTLAADGTATYIYNNYPTGFNVMTANYNGAVDTDYADAVDTINYDVEKENPTLQLTANPANNVSGADAIYGDTITFTAKVTNIRGTIDADDSVAFTIKNALNQQILLTVPVDANGIATFTATGLTATGLNAGRYTVTARYNNNIDNNKADDTMLDYFVMRASPKITLTANQPSPIIYGTEVTFTSTVTGILNYIPSPADSVTFTIDGAYVPVVDLDANGVATYTTTILPVGTHTIGAIYNGNKNNKPIFVTITFTVYKNAVIPTPPIPPVVSTGSLGSLGSDAGIIGTGGLNSSSLSSESSNSSSSSGSSGTSSSSGLSVSNNSNSSNTINPDTGVESPVIIILFIVLMLASTVVVVKVKQK